jgi:hypothetical protein
MFSHKGLDITPGGVLLSHLLTGAVPSALQGLTAVFGMGTGVSPALSLPEKIFLLLSGFL